MVLGAVPNLFARVRRRGGARLHLCELSRPRCNAARVAGRAGRRIAAYFPRTWLFALGVQTRRRTEDEALAFAAGGFSMFSIRSVVIALSALSATPLFGFGIHCKYTGNESRFSREGDKI